MPPENQQFGFAQQQRWGSVFLIFFKHLNCQHRKLEDTIPSSWVDETGGSHLASPPNGESRVCATKGSVAELKGACWSLHSGSFGHYLHWATLAFWLNFAQESLPSLLSAPLLFSTVAFLPAYGLTSSKQQQPFLRRKRKQMEMVVRIGAMPGNIPAIGLMMNRPSRRAESLRAPFLSTGKQLMSLRGAQASGLSRHVLRFEGWELEPCLETSQPLAWWWTVPAEEQNVWGRYSYINCFSSVGRMGKPVSFLQESKVFSSQCLPDESVTWSDPTWPLVKRNCHQILWNAVEGDFHSFTITRFTSLIVVSDMLHLLISSTSSVGSSARSGFPRLAALALTSIVSAISSGDLSKNKLELLCVSSESSWGTQQWIWPEVSWSHVVDGLLNNQGPLVHSKQRPSSSDQQKLILLPRRSQKR